MMCAPVWIAVATPDAAGSGEAVGRGVGVLLGFFVIYAGILLVVLHAGGARFVPYRHGQNRTMMAWLGFVAAGWVCHLVDAVASRIWQGFLGPLAAVAVTAWICAIGILAVVYEPALRRLPGLALIYTLVPLALSTGFLFLAEQIGAAARGRDALAETVSPGKEVRPPAFDVNLDTARAMGLAIRRQELEQARQRLADRRAGYGTLNEADRMQYRADSSRYHGALKAFRRDLALE